MGSSALTLVFAALLLLAGVLSVAGLGERLRLGGKGACVAGVASGLFGGLVGNQGGIRAAALLGFNLRKEAFVATATAVALVVDGARLPVYLLTQGEHIWAYTCSCAPGRASNAAALCLTALVRRRRRRQAQSSGRFRRRVKPEHRSASPAETRTGTTISVGDARAEFLERGFHGYARVQASQSDRAARS